MPAATKTTTPTGARKAKTQQGAKASPKAAVAKPTAPRPAKPQPPRPQATTPQATTASATQSSAVSPMADARAHPPPLPPSGAHVRSPASRSARDLFDQAGHELAEAVTATHVYDRYCGAHIAALRAAAAVVNARSVPAPPGRRRPRSVWDLLYRSAPELADWAAYFASGATRRAAAEAGLPNAVTAQEATDLIREAEVFLGVVAAILGIPYQDGLLYADPAGEQQQAS